MRLKLSIAAVVALIFATMLVLPHANDSDRAQNRYHQHLEAQQKAPCTDHGSGVFCSHLPLISVDLGGELPEVFAPKEAISDREFVSTELTGMVYLFDNAEENNHLTDEYGGMYTAKVRYRGQSSKEFDKHNLKLSFITDDGSEDKTVSLLGMEPHDEWVLHGPFLDRSLIRNYFCMNIAGEIMEYTPDVRFCELFINGEYQGVYVAMESVARGEGRVDISSYVDGHDVTPYIVKLDWLSSSEPSLNTFIDYTNLVGVNHTMSVVYPGKDTIDQQLMRYIKDDLSAFQKALHSYDHDSPVYGYKAHIDVDSFVDYVIINEFFDNYDAGSASTFFFRDLRGKLHIGPVWDFNNSMGGYDGRANDEYVRYYVVNKTPYEMLMLDEDFVRRVIARYRQLRETVLSEEYLLGYIDDVTEYLGDAADRNFQKWGYTLDPETVPETIKLRPTERNPRSHEEAIRQIKDYIADRGAWLDAHIETLLQFCHESATKKYDH